MAPETPPRKRPAILLAPIIAALVLGPALAWGLAGVWKWWQHEPARRSFEKGNTLYRKGELQGAVDAWQAAVTAEPGWVEPYFRISDAFWSTGRSDLGINVLQAALQANPAAPHLRCRIAADYLRAQDSLNSGLWAEKAVQSEPTCSRAHLVYARTHRGSLEEAQSHLEQAAQLAPLDPEPLIELAKLQAEAGNLAGGEATLERVLKLQRHDDRTRYLLGMIQARKAKDAAGFREAETHLKEAIRLNPNGHDAYAELGLLYERQRRWQEAARSFEKARALSPHSAAILFHLATVYQRVGDPRVAAVRRDQQRLQTDSRRWADLRAQLARHPEDLELALDTAEAAARLGARVIALNLTESVLRKQPKHPRALDLQERLTTIE